MSTSMCPYCTAGAEELEYDHGVLTCNRCGQQLQGMQEEAEYQQGIDDVRGRRTAAGINARTQLSQAAQLERQEQAAEQQLKDATLLYVRSLQQLLRAQGYALHKQFGVSVQVLPLLREMWLTLLPQTGILEPAPHKMPSPAPDSTAAGTSGACYGAATAINQEGDEWPLKRFAAMTFAKLVSAHNMQQLLWKILHPQTTLQLCFIACTHLREAVTHQDIMTWALDGRLPFLQLPTFVNQTTAAGTDGSCLPVRCIQPQLTLEPASFLRRCCHLASRLGVRLAPLAGEGMLMRAVKELALPQIVYEAALQLYTTHLINSPLMEYETAEGGTPSRAPPYVWLASVLVISIKFLYGLGYAAGQTQMVPKAANPPGGWQTWAHQVVESLPGMSSLPLTEQEVLALGPDALHNYMKFCRQYIFAGHPVVKSLDDVQRLLTGWYEASLKAQGSGQQQQHGASSPSDLWSTVHSTHPSNQQQQHPSDTQEQQQQAGSRAAGSTALSIYNITLMGPDMTAGSIRLEPALKAVVVAIAAYYRVSHSGLVQCVRKVERQIAAIESKIAQNMRVDFGAE